jgi:hypothetical protein
MQGEHRGRIIRGAIGSESAKVNKYFAGTDSRRLLYIYSKYSVSTLFRYSRDKAQQSLPALRLGSHSRLTLWKKGFEKSHTSGKQGKSSLEQWSQLAIQVETSTAWFKLKFTMYGTTVLSTFALVAYNFLQELIRTEVTGRDKVVIRVRQSPLPIVTFTIDDRIRRSSLSIPSALQSSLTRNKLFGRNGELKILYRPSHLRRFHLYWKNHQSELLQKGTSHLQKSPWTEPKD